MRTWRLSLLLLAIFSLPAFSTFHPLPLYAQSTHWLHSKLPLSSLTKVMSIAAANPNDIAVSCSGGGDALILRSTNAGITWDTVWQVGIGGVMNIHDIAHPTPDIIVAAVDSTFSWTEGNTTFYAQAGSIISSRDGGQTWTQTVFGFKDKDKPSHEIQRLEMIDENVGIAAVASKPLFRTTNGGETWEAMPSPSDNMAFTQVLDVLDHNSIVLSSYSYASQELKLYRTTNGGATWDSSAIDQSLRDIKMINNDLGYATGYEWGGTPMDGFVLKTTNGGMDWITVFDTAFGAGDPLVCLEFFDEHQGFVFGRDGLLLSTTDGGSTWGKEIIQYNLGVDMGVFFDADIVRKEPFPQVVAVGGDAGMVMNLPNPLLPWPRLVVPSYGMMTAKTFTAHWLKSAGAERYEMNLITNAWPRELILSETSLTDTFYSFNKLTEDSYFIEVRAISSDNVSNWSKVLFSTMLQQSVDVTNDDDQIQLYPNPATSNNLKVIYSDSYGDVTAKIVNTLGVAIMSCDISNDHSIDISSLTPGVYSIILTGRQGASTKGFIKAR